METEEWLSAVGQPSHESGPAEGAPDSGLRTLSPWDQSTDSRRDHGRGAAAAGVGTSHFLLPLPLPFPFPFPMLMYPV